MDYDYEQDRHLRTLARNSRKAEDEALVAVHRLAICLKQRRMLIIFSFLSTILAVAMGGVTLFAIYGHQ